MPPYVSSSGPEASSANSSPDVRLSSLKLRTDWAGGAKAVVSALRGHGDGSGDAKDQTRLGAVAAWSMSGENSADVSDACWPP